jgi:glycosyltransferase involved in cell wall biosynthesis
VTAVLVTVIIPTYRRADLVPRAIRSVLAQTHRHFEAVIVDDCSPDDTAAAVRAIADPRIRYVRHERNKGLPAARNTGVRAARGSYIAFLDDDDEWKPHKLERQLASIGDCDAVLCATEVNGLRVTRYRKERITAADLRKGNRFAPSGLLVKTTVLRDLWFDETLRVGEDWDAYIRIAHKYRIGYVREPLVIYYQQGQTSMTSEAKDLSVEDLERRMPVLHKHERFLGPFWMNYHVASYLLSFIGSRKRKLRHLIYTMRRCGVVPVTAVLVHKLRGKISGVVNERVAAAARWYGNKPNGGAIGWR